MLKSNKSFKISSSCEKPYVTIAISMNAEKEVITIEEFKSTI